MINLKLAHTMPTPAVINILPVCISLMEILTLSALGADASQSIGLGEAAAASRGSLDHFAWLGEFCERSSDCQPEYSECDSVTNTCTCRPYTVEANVTTCLPGTLLGFRCETDAQCAVKVPKSGCINGVCACGQNYIAHRRHTCLAPAKLDEICMENEQCTLADKWSYCKFVIPRAYGRCQCEPGRERNPATNKCSPFPTKLGQICSEDNECTMENGFCQNKLDGSSVCTCEVGYTPSSDRTKCLPTYRGLLSATSLGYPCHANLECMLSDPNSFCNAGVCDCAASVNSNSSLSCSAKNTGCHKHTFQCHSDGKCISWYFVCDGTIDCADGSDEMCEFTSEGECPSQAFQCGRKFDGAKTDKSKGKDSPVLDKRNANATQTQAQSLTSNAVNPNKITCISRSKVCDKKVDCPDRSDELNCKEQKGKCPPGTFSCTSTKECLPEHHFCNAIADCFDVSDEDEFKCRSEFQPSDYCPFRCDNGLCRSTAILCSDVDGCGDNSDEKNCRVCRCPKSV